MEQHLAKRGGGDAGLNNWGGVGDVGRNVAVGLGIIKSVERNVKRCGGGVGGAGGGNYSVQRALNSCFHET
jgi:hypothetical protein